MAVSWWTLLLLETKRVCYERPINGNKMADSVSDDDVGYRMESSEIIRIFFCKEVSRFVPPTSKLVFPGPNKTIPDLFSKSKYSAKLRFRNSGHPPVTFFLLFFLN